MPVPYNMSHLLRYILQVGVVTPDFLCTCCFFFFFSQQVTGQSYPWSHFPTLPGHWFNPGRHPVVDPNDRLHDLCGSVRAFGSAWVFVAVRGRGFVGGLLNC